MSYTKGPWIADCRSGCVAVYQESRRNDTPGLHCDDNRNIFYSNKGAHYNGKYWEMDQETQDNFVLAAAAPDLLEALKDLARDEYLDDDDPQLAVSRQKARLAIAKAEGERE